MPEDKNFTVNKLLTHYKKRIGDNKIVFLQANPTVKDKIVHDLDDLTDNHFPKIEKKPEELEWHKVHKIVERLWQDLTSCALNSIDPNSKGNSKLFDYLKEATKFEDLLYGLEPYYRDHTLHSLWVYLIGDNLLDGDLINIYKQPNWYLFNDLKKEKAVYKKDLVKFSKMKKEMVCYEVNEHKDAIWCIIALCHDLGYSLSKLDKLNERVQEVLKYFDIPEFRHIGYSSDIEYQYLMSQFLELMAMEVRIVPGEDYGIVRNNKNISNLYDKWKKLKKAKKSKKEYQKAKKEIIKKIPRNYKDNLLIKCYRDDSTYWRLCRAMEKKEHGILSSYLIYKILGIFAESSVRGTAEVWGLNDIEAKENTIRGDILFAIAQHEFDFAHLNQLGSFGDLLIVCDELEEFSRYGRQLQSREYTPTTANTSIIFKTPGKKAKAGNNTKIKPGQKIHLTMHYDAKHEDRDDFIHFFYRKAKKLCSIYSLKPSDEQREEEETEKEDYCTITNIEMRVEWKKPQKKAAGLPQFLVPVAMRVHRTYSPYLVQGVA